jgi:hypothetical protein
LLTGLWPNQPSHGQYLDYFAIPVDYSYRSPTLDQAALRPVTVDVIQPLAVEERFIGAAGALETLSLHELLDVIHRRADRNLPECDLDHPWQLFDAAGDGPRVGAARGQHENHGGKRELHSVRHIRLSSAAYPAAT